MAWEHSFSPEVWPTVERNLYRLGIERLAEIYLDLEWSKHYNRAGERWTYLGNHERCMRYALIRRERFRRRYAHIVLDNPEIMVSSFMDRIHEVGLCDNGGWGVWIDSEGYHTVSTEEACEHDDCPEDECKEDLDPEDTWKEHVGESTVTEFMATEHETEIEAAIESHVNYLVRFRDLHKGKVAGVTKALLAYANEHMPTNEECGSNE